MTTEKRLCDRCFDNFISYTPGLTRFTTCSECREQEYQFNASSRKPEKEPEPEPNCWEYQPTAAEDAAEDEEREMHYGY